MFIYISSTEVPSVSCIENMFFSTDLTLQPSFQPSTGTQPGAGGPWKLRTLHHPTVCTSPWLVGYAVSICTMPISTYYELVGFSSTWLISFKDLVCWGARFLKWWKVGIIYPKSFDHPAMARQIREEAPESIVLATTKSICWLPGNRNIRKHPNESAVHNPKSAKLRHKFHHDWSM